MRLDEERRSVNARRDARERPVVSSCSTVVVQALGTGQAQVRFLVGALVT